LLSVWDEFFDSEFSGAGEFGVPDLNIRPQPSEDWSMSPLALAAVSHVATAPFSSHDGFSKKPEEQKKNLSAKVKCVSGSIGQDTYYQTVKEMRSLS